MRRFTAYSEQDTGFARRREAPYGLATLVFNLGEELHVEHPTDTCTAFSAGTGFFAGLHRRSIPAICRELGGVPSSTLYHYLHAGGTLKAPGFRLLGTNTAGEVQAVFPAG